MKKAKINKKMKDILIGKNLKPGNLTITYVPEPISPNNQRFVFKYTTGWFSSIKVVRWYDDENEMLECFPAVVDVIAAGIK